jgi:hypothetical protein
LQRKPAGISSRDARRFLRLGYFPVPVRVTDCGEALPLSVMVSFAVKAAAVAGVNAT